MRYVKWIFVVLLISSLTSFVEKDKTAGGLNVGDIAPDFKLQSMLAEQFKAGLSDLKGKYVVLSFWASYDAHSRMQNASLSNALRSTSRSNVEMVSISFDKYQSIFEETIRKDQIVTPICFVETKGEYSSLFKMYRLGQGFTNYLLDDNGVIIAKNISAAELSAYLTSNIIL
ncbi:redoxin domain-containing protein [Bacteroides helcogenes]|uniref:Alkyl hydroperoxide reductase/ Thiol specific antioxidant/ Mal allergen n=1 Tax=Bacteroides helcogenes (strain ATCC 35417 / DSM 20613 / JCM 6297 / CCUG 15421 / P 36-108) TaxID=693979 RepID=E6STP7_BACT6|nr:thioredoxin-like domain-containing protein [Bacteroides helcogenes]ADV44294.1 alkyl hydroperoxide reductase/ Thiol specific antioxidant/ Mal allergen [Bacteroides helcogenes P 36-108]MDY5238294.1 thioredoxin-like domain-containing protein [Bacteroides helcogenes]